MLPAIPARAPIADSQSYIQTQQEPFAARPTPLQMRVASLEGIHLTIPYGALVRLNDFRVEYFRQPFCIVAAPIALPSGIKLAATAWALVIQDKH